MKVVKENYSSRKVRETSAAIMDASMKVARAIQDEYDKGVVPSTPKKKPRTRTKKRTAHKK